MTRQQAARRRAIATTSAAIFWLVVFIITSIEGTWTAEQPASAITHYQR